MTLDPAQPFGSLSPAARAEMHALGPVWGRDIEAHRARVIEAYTPIVRAAPTSGVRRTADVAYGSHERQKLDVFVRPNLQMADVVLFIHGGAYVRGSKSGNGAIYDNVCRWFAKNGLVALNVEYRLAQDAPYPGGALDVAAAVDWTIRNVAAFGGDASRIFLFGHSAGGTHVATYALDPRLSAHRRPEVRGMVLVSGRLRADVRDGNPNAAGVRAYFGADASAYGERSPVTHAHACTIPAFVAIAEFENPYLDVYGAEFFYRLASARDVAPRFVRMQGHNHTSIVAHFDSGEDLLGRNVLDFIATGR